MVGSVVGRAQARAEVISAVEHLLGPRGSEATAMLLDGAAADGGWLLATLGLAVALFGASRAFVHMQTAFNRIFAVQPRKPESLGEHVKLVTRKRGISIGLVLAVAATILVSALAEPVVVTLAALAGTVVDEAPLAIWIARVATPLVLMMGFLTLVYRTLPDATVSWRDAVAGALVAGVGIAVGAQLVSMYLTEYAARSIPAAAGTMIITLAWLYVTSLLLLLGAATVVTTARRAGRAQPPEEHAVGLRRVVPTASAA
jgi:membrane protein